MMKERNSRSKTMLAAAESTYAQRFSRRENPAAIRNTAMKRNKKARRPPPVPVSPLRFEADGSVKLVQLPNPQSGPEDVVVQVLAAGVCHTDPHLLDEVKAGERQPLIPGHEIVGRVSKIGADVYASSVGDRVVVHFEQPCGQCRQCRRKRTNLCEKGHSLGFDAPGGYAEFVVAKQNTILPLPPNLDPAVAAPLGCSGATAYRSVVALGQADEDDLVIVIGAGGVGLSAIQIARVQGARVLA